ncbi:helix-turn-helix domain-containing protein [Saliterribacillus persicus]|uniref:DNA-binding transcriptional MerR regulator n=1 Tax=Saliterribacillus persicus TaxID=930114 RepID=A0A368X5T9_9BACI|nr:helix-turn-helix domain-containing protein [Saliterribacillus persicus]RCW63382.1 DNA-binding transcriptional MerR regulator [Saliterribacillus persicus]
MKMKEVCNRTGLTERTVRFYTKENLVNPTSTERNGRVYLEYSEQEVDELKTVAELRKVFFSIAEIKEMKLSTEKITEILTEYKNKLDTDLKVKASIVQSLQQINIASIHDVHSLADSLKNVSTNLQLPKRDVNPDFDKFDQESKEDKKRKYQLFNEQQQESYIIGKLIIYIIVFLHIVFSTIITLSINLNLIAYLLLIAFGAALIVGITWVRYLFIAGVVINVLLTLEVFIGGNIWSLSSEFKVFLIIQIICSIIYGILLIVHPGIKEYEYVQKVGR